MSCLPTEHPEEQESVGAVLNNGAQKYPSSVLHQDDGTVESVDDHPYIIIESTTFPSTDSGGATEPNLYTGVRGTFPMKKIQKQLLSSEKKTFLSDKVRELKLSRKSCLCVLYSTIGVILFVCFTSVFVELDKLKKDYSSSKQLSQMLNASLHQQLEQSLSLQQSSLDQLLAGVGKPGQYSTLPIAACSALPPSSPSGYYWIRTAFGSSERVYCDVTRLCGGVAGGWMRVAKLDMANSNEQCPRGGKGCKSVFSPIPVSQNPSILPTTTGW